MGRGRKKRPVHPGKSCGPCHLCQQYSTHFCHIITWEEEMKEMLRELVVVSDTHCICRACEGDFKRNAGKDGHRYRWMTGRTNGPGSNRCIVASCKESRCIIHTGVATRERIAQILGEEVNSEPRHLLTPLCDSHYRYLHRSLHSNDEMYNNKRCYTCRSHIHGKARHCPNPDVVQQFFIINGDTDITISKNDYICTKCYNYHLIIVQGIQCVSTDQELKELLSSEQPPALWGDTYS